MEIAGLKVPALSFPACSRKGALFLETPHQAGPPFCGWGSRNWVLIPTLSFRGAEAQAALLPQLDLLLLHSVGVQSLTCHLRGTECPERSGLESPHDCSQRGCSLGWKEVAPRVRGRCKATWRQDWPPAAPVYWGLQPHLPALGLSFCVLTHTQTHMCVQVQTSVHARVKVGGSLTSSS